ncbi:MAG: hypothetical protein ACRD2I_04595 [Vicinamibacterales bacterium]
MTGALVNRTLTITSTRLARLAVVGGAAQFRTTFANDLLTTSV